jgi:hypothetical protein
MRATELARDIGSFAYDPLKHCLYAFPWGEPAGRSRGMTGPRKWQGDVMVTIRDHLANPETRFQPLAHRDRVRPRHRQVGRDRDAVASGRSTAGSMRG